MFEWRGSKRVAMIAVFTAVVVDCVLTTTVIPFIPFIIEDLFLRGLFFASKVIAQFLCNPLSALITERIGRRIPILFGNLVLIISCLFYIHFEDYHYLILSRVLQGIGSSFLIVTALEFLGDSVEVADERKKLIGQALRGQPLGLIIGPIIGGLAYSPDDKSRTLLYIILGAATGLEACFFLILDPRMRQTVPMLSDGEVGDETPAVRELRSSLNLSFFRLLNDGNVLIIMLMVIVTVSMTGFLEPTLPRSWLTEAQTADPKIIGAIFSCVGFGGLLGIPIIEFLSLHIRRYLLVFFGMVVASFSLPSCFIFGIYYTCIPLFLLGCGTSFVTLSVVPMLMRIIDTRTSGDQTESYIVADASVNLGLIIGPLIGTLIAKKTSSLLYTAAGFGGLVLLVSPIAFLVRGATKFLPTNSRSTSVNQKESDEPFLADFNHQLRPAPKLAWEKIGKRHRKSVDGPLQIRDPSFESFLDQQSTESLQI